MRKIFKKLIQKDLFFAQNNYKLANDFKALNIINILSKVFLKIRSKRKKQLYILFFLMFFSGISEFLALSAIIPFLTAITDINNLIKYKFINTLYITLRLTNPNQLIILTTIIFLLMIYLSAILRLVNLLFNYRLTAAIGSELSSECYRKTLYQPYEKHIETNSSVLINTVSKDINKTVNGLSNFLIIINSIIIAVSIFVGLLVVNAKIAIVLGVIFISSYLLIGIKNRIQIEKNSYVITSKSQDRIKALQEGLGAIKEILLGNSQDYYTDIYRKTDFPIRILRARNNFLGTFPKFLLETLGITCIAIIGAYISSNGLSGRAISLIGFIGLGSQRLLPALQTIYSSWVGLKSSTASIVNVINLLNEKGHTQCNHRTEEVILKKYLEFKDVNFKYGKNKPLVIKNLNLIIKVGERIGIIGKTGSGKSTAVDLLMTLIKPSNGKILIDGKDINKYNSNYSLNSWRSQITHVPQQIYLADSTFIENIAFGVDPSNINFSQVKEAAKKALLSEFIESCPDGYETIVGERGIRLSGGQRQRISLARAFYKNRKFFILDEATSSLDHKTEKSVIESIYSLGSDTTLIMIAHRLTTLKNCDRILKFQNGSIVEEGKPSEILK